MQKAKIFGTIRTQLAKERKANSSSVYDADDLQRAIDLSLYQMK
jgi:hypothetical protein